MKMNKKVSKVFLLMVVLAFSFTNSFSKPKTLFLVMKNNSLNADSCRVGFIDTEGKIQIDFKFYYAIAFSEGLSPVILSKGGKWGYADEDGNIVIEPQFDEAASFKNGLAKVSKGEKTFFITRDGKKSFDTALTLLGFGDGLSPARLLGKWGFVNTEGKTVIPFQFEHANTFNENLAAVTQNNLIGYIDKFGDWVIPPRFTPMSGYSDPLFLPNFSDGLAVYRDKNKYGYINKNGIVEIAASFDRAESFSEGLALVRLNGNVGYLRKNGQFGIEPRFENGQKFSNGLASVQVNEKWGYIDPLGKMQILPEYDSAEPFKDGLAKVSKHDEDNGYTIIGYLNKNGKLVYSWSQ